MAIFKCKMCGGALEIQDGSSVAVCSFCGTKQTIPKLDNETRINLYDRANHFRRNNDYDKAMLIYEQLLDADKTDAEAYWSILLCKYGVEYVEDPKTHKMMPTINRAQYTSIFADEDYKSAIQYADGYQREVYENEAKELDKIQKGILSISQKEDPFDIFICYKETDTYGRRTQDSVLAQDLYYQLTKEGFKVFFSRITLEDKLGTAYEPYIFAALNTAKIMVVIGTSKENLNSVWVKNEWSRFLALTKKDNSKVLIPAYRDMDPYDLPEEFSHLQAQDMSKLGFMQDLIRGIKKILAKDEKIVVIPQNNATNSNGNVDALLKRAYIACEDGDFTKADSFAEKVLNINPELADAYIVKLLAECKVRKLDGLRTYSAVVKAKSNFQRAYKYAQGELKAQLSAIGKENVEYIEYYPIYCKAQNYIKQNDYSQAIVYLSKIQSYKNSAELLAQCKENLAVQKKENTYNAAIIAGFSKTADEGTMLRSIGALRSLDGYKDSLAQIDKLYARIEKYRYQQQVEAEKAKELAARRKHKRKIGAIVTATSAVVLVAVLLMTFFWFIPLSEYNDAENLVKSRKYEEALAKYKDLNGFSESDAHIAALNAVLNASEYFEEGSLNAGLNEVYSQNGTITVNYDCGAGQISQDDEASTVSSKLEQGEEFTIPYRAGYAFVKWEFVGYSVSYNLKAVLAKVSLLAIWEKCDYTVSFDLDGGYLSYKPSWYRYESEDITIGTPTKKGYTFLGWSGTEIDGLTTDLVIKQGSEGDRHYIAQWQANTYTVTFNLNGGTMDATQLQVTYDTYVSLPTPKKFGSTFSGWHCEGKKIDSGEWNLIKDCTLDAQWDLITYTILYNLNGGTNASENPSSYTAYDEFSLQEPTKTGYTFLGWTFSGQREPLRTINISTGTIGDKEYTAHWSVNSYTVNYDANNGTTSKISDTATFGSEFILATAERLGYKFLGWFNGQQNVSSGIWSIDSDVTLKAKWEIIEYEIKYNLDGGTTTNKNTYTILDSIVLTQPIKIGYSFLGWTDAQQSTPTKTITIPSGTIGEKEYTAHWQVNSYKVTYTATGGESSKTEDTFIYDTDIDLPTATRKGYSFMGWYYNGNIVESGIWKIAEDCVLVAKWEIIVYSISYNMNYGNTNNRTTYTIETETFSLAEPTKPVCVFLGWTYEGQSSPQKDVIIEQGSIGDKSFTANWEDCLSYAFDAANNAYIVTGFADGYMISDLEIPPIHNGIPITAIGAKAFYGTSIKTIIIPDTVTIIYYEAFSNCEALENAVLGSSIIKIYDEAFKSCVRLTNVQFGNMVEYIGANAFYGSRLKGTVVLPSSLVKIGDSAFGFCFNLEKVYIPQSVTIMGSYIFDNSGPYLGWECSLLEIYIKDGTDKTNWNSKWNYCSTGYVASITKIYNW